MIYLLLLIGFAFLIKGADLFVDGSSAIAKIFKVPSIIIGLTIVALGTSAPETAVSIAAALKGQNEIALSNVIGSNIFNLMVVVGICAIIKPIFPAKAIVKRDLPVSILCAAVLVVFSINFNIGRIEGFLMLAGLAVYLYILLKATKKEQMLQKDTPTAEESEKPHLTKSLLFILIGIVGIVMGGDMVVDSATHIATAFGLSSTLIGLTIVAFGTSLPELVTSIVAAKKGENELALGNVVGSNILNILLVLGVSAILSPMRITLLSVYDIGILIIFSLLIFGYAFINKKINRVAGAAMVIMYIGFTVYIIIR